MNTEITPEALDYLIRACHTHQARLAQKARRHQRIIDKYEAGAIPPPDYKETDPDKILAEARRRIEAKERALSLGEDILHQLETMQYLQFKQNAAQLASEKGITFRRDIDWENFCRGLYEYKQSSL